VHKASGSGCRRTCVCSMAFGLRVCRSRSISIYYIAKLACREKNHADHVTLKCVSIRHAYIRPSTDDMKSLISDPPLALSILPSSINSRAQILQKDFPRKVKGHDVNIARFGSNRFGIRPIRSPVAQVLFQHVWLSFCCLNSGNGCYRKVQQLSSEGRPWRCQCDVWPWHWRKSVHLRRWRLR
jgi:hypothetical protein